jgi:hypothetical protein
MNTLLKEICIEAFASRSAMVKLSLSKDNKSSLLSATSWMDNHWDKIPNRVRCLVVINDLDDVSYPKCPNCNKPVGWNKLDQSSLNKFCSDKCSKAFGRLSIDVKEKLYSYDWLYEQRIVNKISHIHIGQMLSISDTKVMAACKLLKIPHIRLNEAVPEVKMFLANKEWLYDQHVIQKKKCHEIANMIGSSGSVISAKLREHGIETNQPNSYDRPFVKRSKGEIEVADYVSSLGFDIKTSVRSILGNNQELDVVVPSKSIAIEYNGLNSHCYKWPSEPDEIVKDKNYHLNKTNLAKEKGFTLIHIFSDTWQYKKEIVKSILNSKLGISDKIYARKCKIVTPLNMDKISFLENNHIQGKDQSTIYYGLEYEKELVAVMTFRKSRYNKSYTWELSRFATKKFITIVGGFSKLLSHFRKSYSGSIISYADRSISEGNVYQVNGFTLLKVNRPAYTYTKYDKRLHRAGFMKKKIAPNDPRPEHEIMLERGYAQVYDCGTLAFIFS